MRGTKFTNRIYFSKDGNKLIINEDPLPIQLASQNLMLKGKMIKRKKTYKIPMKYDRVSSLSAISQQPLKPRQDVMFSRTSIKKDCLRIESRMNTHDILSYLKMKCSDTYNKTQTHFINPYESKEIHQRSGRIGVAIRRMQTTESKKRLSNGSGDLKSTDLGGETPPSQLIESPVLSKSQSPIKPKAGPRSYTNPISLIKIPKIQQRLKLVQITPKSPNKNRALLSINPLELKHVKSESYAMIECESEQLVLINRGKQSLEIASLTKIMTAYLIISMAQKRDVDLAVEVIEVGDYVESITGTSAELIAGDIYSIQQLLYGLLLPSGNDAALVLADWGGSILNKEADKINQYKQNTAAFVQEMTRTARELGLKDTRYGNPHGLPHPEGKSTAMDQCKLASLCIKMPLFQKITKVKEYQFETRDCDGNKRLVFWQNTNKLLRRQGFVGLKTGITVTAGPCLISAYEFRSKKYILTVLRSNKISRRFKDTRKILCWALTKLYSGNLCPQQSTQLQQLNKNKPQLDSDNSEDQNEFVYGEGGSQELTRRIQIITNQL